MATDEGGKYDLAARARTKSVIQNKIPGLFTKTIRLTYLCLCYVYNT